MMMLRVLVITLVFAPLVYCSRKMPAVLGQECGMEWWCQAGECAAFKGKKHCTMNMTSSCPEGQVICSEGCCNGSCDSNGKNYYSCSKEKRVGEECDADGECVRHSYGRVYEGLKCEIVAGKKRCTPPVPYCHKSNRCTYQCCYRDNSECECNNNECSCVDKPTKGGNPNEEE